jgi:uncharacterized DUF497 family protein
VQFRFNWNEEKSKKLLKERGFCFEDLVNKGKILDVVKNKSSLHANQRELHIEYENYVYRAPFVVEKDGTIFLKTAHRDRNLKKMYHGDIYE